MFAREFRDRLKLMVLIDNGGYSMEPYQELVKSVFGKISENFKDLKYYYFHNCLYGTVFENMERTQAAPWETLVAGGRRYAPHYNRRRHCDHCQRPHRASGRD